MRSVLAFRVTARLNSTLFLPELYPVLGQYSAFTPLAWAMDYPDFQRARLSA